MRQKKEIKKFEERLDKIVWWNRHKLLEEKWEITGMPKKYVEVFGNAMEMAEKIEEEIPKEELIISDFKFGMVCGKLSALRWVLGENWDQLDTLVSPKRTRS